MCASWRAIGPRLIRLWRQALAQTLNMIDGRVSVPSEARLSQELYASAPEVCGPRQSHRQHHSRPCDVAAAVRVGSTSLSQFAARPADQSYLDLQQPRVGAAIAPRARRGAYPGAHCGQSSTASAHGRHAELVATS